MSLPDEAMKLKDGKIIYDQVASMVAVQYSEAEANPAGSYVIYNGSVYLLPNGHTANVSWANTEKEGPTNIGEKLSSQLTEITHADYEVKQIEKLNFNLLYGATWEMGAFNPTSSDVASNNKIRTGYISVEGMNRIILGCDDDYKFYGLMYDKNMAVVSGSEFGWTTNSKLIIDLANDFPTAKYVRLCFQKSDGTADVTIASHMRGIYYNEFVDYIYRSYLLSDAIYGTTQAVTKDSSGRITQITHSSGGSVIRTDTITYGDGTITETRTGFNLTVTITTNLTTLAVEVA